MKKIKTIHSRNIPNKAHCSYCNRVFKAFSEIPSAGIVLLGDLPGQFQALVNKEEAIIAWVEASILTEQIKQADARMDNAYIVISYAIRMNERKPVAAIAEAAREIGVMLKQYGNVCRLPYDDQIAAIEAIIVHLSTTYDTQVELLGLGDERAELLNAFAAFTALIAQRDAEQKDKPDENFAEVRREITRVYLDIVDIVNSGSRVGNRNFDKFIDVLNPDIERMNRQYSRPKIDITHAQPAPIDNQKHTGNPVTPVPHVLYVTPKDGTVQLFLGKDFDLSYKNNIDVGSAECYIHGKGSYTGTKSVSFAIVREK